MFDIFLAATMSHLSPHTRRKDWMDAPPPYFWLRIVATVALLGGLLVALEVGSRQAPDAPPAQPAE